MSDNPDEILRRLEKTKKQLEAAHADYLRANTESQKALSRVLDAFADLTQVVQHLLVSDQVDFPAPSDQPAQSPNSSPTPESCLPADSPHPSSPSHSSNEDRPSSNATLPARLQSRGGFVPPEMATEGPASPPENPRRRHPGVTLERPTLALSSTSGQPFPALQQDRRIVVTNDGFGVAPIVTNLLSQRGFRVRLEGRRPELSSPADLVIFLGSLRSPNDLDDAMAVVDDAMAAADKMTTRLMQPGSGFIAVIDTAGGFGLDHFDPVAAPFGALLGLIRLLSKHYPGASSKLIDLNGGHLQADVIARHVVDELLAGGADSPVALTENHRRTVEWTEFVSSRRPADWLLEHPGPLIYMPGPEGILATAVERLAIAHELPVAILRRRGVPAQFVRDFGSSDIETRSTDYDLQRLFSVMDFFDRLRSDHGPISAIITESFPASRNEITRWEHSRPLLAEFNALLAMTINDPLHLLGVGIGPNTPPVLASALRYFARAESLRRNEYLQVRLAHINRPSSPRKRDLDPRNFALTEFLSAADPVLAEVRFDRPLR